MTTQRLLPDHHPNLDFFVPDIFENLPIKDDIASMEHPLFTLSTKRDFREVTYQNGNITVSITPSMYGLPTISDKDILLYCGSLVMSHINKGKETSKRLQISVHDLMVATNRPTSGEGYKLVKQAMKRLNGVSITTNIKTNDIEQTSGFHLIEGYKIIERGIVEKRMTGLEIVLSDWFYNSLLANEVLTISRKYFRLRKPTERRIYELARKHCGGQDHWSIALAKLHLKSGSSATLRKFRYFIREIQEVNHLPDYEIQLSDNDIVHFSSKKKPALPQNSTHNTPANCRHQLKEETIEKAKTITRNSGTGWDFYALLSEFETFVDRKGQPDSFDGAFIGFVKKKVANTS